jgi:hypothetical protein
MVHVLDWQRRLNEYQVGRILDGSVYLFGN